MNLSFVAGRIRALIVTCALVWLGFPTAPAISAEASPMTTTPITICSSQAVPAGFVVLSARASSSCGGFSELVIAQPTATDVNLTVCGIGPIIGGNWIYTNIAPLGGSSVCSSSFNEMRIHQVQTSETSSTYCNFSQSLPAGWAVTNVIAGTGGNCAQYQTMVASRLASSGASICDIGVNISAPWVAVQVFPGNPSGPCKNFQQMTAQAAVANGVPMQICGVLSLQPPPGFVISGVSPGQSGGVCANYAPETIMSVGHLAVGSRINVCVNSPVPSGWIVVSSNPWQAGGPCAAFATNTIQRVS